jgi:hypothetical protein
MNNGESGQRSFASETAKHRGFCEATSLAAFGPHGQKAHNPRGMYKGVSPLYTFSFAYFFVV